MKKLALIALLAVSLNACSQKAVETHEAPKAAAQNAAQPKRPDDLTVRAFRRMGIDANRMFDLAMKFKEGTITESEQKELQAMQEKLAKNLKVQTQAAPQ